MVLGILPYVKNGNDPGMVQTSCRLRLMHEAQTEFLFLVRLLAPQRDSLHRDHTVDLRIPGLVHHTHGPAAQLRHDLVPAKLLDLGIVHGIDP